MTTKSTSKTTATKTTSKKTTTKAPSKKAATPKAGGEAKAAPAKPAKEKKAQPDKPKKLSALDAAAKFLGESSEPMATNAMIEAMSAKGYWTNPGGQTPSATLYAAIIREINLKGAESRFKKIDRGLFTLAGK